MAGRLASQNCSSILFIWKKKIDPVHNNGSVVTFHRLHDRQAYLDYRAAVLWNWPLTWPVLIHLIFGDLKKMPINFKDPKIIMEMTQHYYKENINALNIKQLFSIYSNGERAFSVLAI